MTFEILQPHSRPRDLTNLIVREEIYPVGGGGYADVYTGILKENGTETKVAIKVIRLHIYRDDDKWKIDKRLRREISVWSRLAHPNVIPLLGIVMNPHFGPYAAMVCPWMYEGDLYTYLQNSEVNFSVNRRLEILYDISEGLYYLHTQSIIHGDLMPPNVLMNQGKAHLADFGLSNVIVEVRGPSFMTSTVGGSVRWAAPELYQADGNHISGPELTTHCDVYSLGSVALYVLSGRIPYENIRDHAVIHEVAIGNHPPRPSDSPLTEDGWNFIKLCWDREPSKRPDASQIKDLLVDLQLSEIRPTYLSSNESRTEGLHDVPDGTQVAESIDISLFAGLSMAPLIEINLRKQSSDPRLDRESFDLEHLHSEEKSVPDGSFSLQPVGIPPVLAVKSSSIPEKSKLQNPRMTYEDAYAPFPLLLPIRPDASWNVVPPQFQEHVPPQPLEPPAQVYDRMDPFMSGHHYGPVLDPLLTRVVRAPVRLNPLISRLPDEGTERPYLKWNMLFPTSSVRRSDDPPHIPWVNGREAPATFPRVISLKIVSTDFPLMIEVRANDKDYGVTCGEVINAIGYDLSMRMDKQAFQNLPQREQMEVTHAYTHNRSQKPGIPGKSLGNGLKKLDFLRVYTMFAGIEVDDHVVKRLCGSELPCVFLLRCAEQYMPTKGVQE